MSSRIKTDVKKLFEFWCEVSRGHGNGNTAGGVITKSFPESFRDAKTIADIPAFAYPCEFESDSVQSYSFVLTTDDSKWRFGFCRHDPKTDSAMVVITYLPWHDTFLRLLTVLAELRRSDNPAEFNTFLSEAYSRNVPDPGGSFKLFYNNGASHFLFERPLQFQLPSIPQNYNLNMYYNFADPKNMIGVFAAMLAERRIIFTSRRLDRLSSCIQAANAFLYPMVWQHIFIPVLPMKLKDYLSAPMPYLIGVPEPVLETMTSDELGEVVILNCDTKIFDSPFDDVHEMPPEIVSQLKKQLSQYHEHIGDRVSKIFLGVLVQLIGGYRDAVEFRDSGKTFNREKFIESRPSHLRPFLTKMMELQIFQQFIDERLEMLNTGLGFSDEFELETVRYAEKIKKRGRNYAFLKNVKDKTNPAVKSAVKSVKEGSRGVKTAYKDLKSKFRDITPPNSTHFRSHLASNSQHDRIDGFVVCKTGGMAGRHSAPSSPIFSSKRVALASSALTTSHATSDALNGAPHALRRPIPLAMSNSSAHIPSNGYPHGSLAAHHHNHHLAASPNVSPASSVGSSEMNLSQELQNHPLFKTPLVDRSLKPSSSLDLNHQRPRMGGPPPARPPPPAHNALQIAASLRATQNPPSALATPSYTNQPFSSKQIAPTAYPYTQAKLPLRPPSAPKPRTATTTGTGTSTSTDTCTCTAAPVMPLTKIATTDSAFDTPPDMVSPPVPARRQHATEMKKNHNSYSSNKGVEAPAVAVAVAVAVTPHRAHHTLDRNCWSDYIEHSNLLLHDTLRSSSSSNTSGCSASSSSSESSASYVSALSTISQQTLNNDLPVPAPRLRRDKESLRSLQPQHLTQSVRSPVDDAMSNDLISLDDSTNTSFDLEDFDPLNQNARPLPTLSKSCTRKSGTLPPTINASVSASTSVSAKSVSNPLYPYFAPQQHRTNTQHSLCATLPPLKPPPLPTSLPPPMPPPDEDFELLRKYGLDQFTLTTTTSAQSNGTTVKSSSIPTTGMSNWTTFD